MQGCRVQRFQNVVFTSHVDRGAVFRAIYKLKELRPSFLFYGRMPRPIAPKCCLYLPRGLLNFSFVNKSFLTPSIIHLHQVQGSHNGHLVKVIFSYSYVIHNTFTSGGTMPQWISFEICQSSHGGLWGVLAPSILLLYQAQGYHIRFLFRVIFMSLMD